MSFTSTVYGPVKSWRFGASLGIDLLLETSTCGFDCVYCQLGAIQRHTAEQRVYVPTARVEQDLAAVDWSAVDVVTFSGNGEPTLALNLGEAIAAVKRHSRAPVMVLTNATMLRDAATRARLHGADVVACKLDAADDATLHRVNRPVEGVDLAAILAGIRALRAEFPGRLAIQCMFLPMNVAQAEELATLLEGLRPDEVHLNTPRRPYPRAWYVAARGNHEGPAPVEEVALKTITLEQALDVEALLRRRLPGVRVLSVYEPASPAAAPGDGE